MRRIALLAMACLFAIGLHAQPAYTVIGNDTTCQIFVYSPGEKSGLHLAWLDEQQQWNDVGQLCASDYSAWGSEKKMFNPYVIHQGDGTWRAVWSVNNYAPCFAVAYSEDLVTWRPQDYPRMSAKGCLEPIMFACDDGTTDIYYKSSNGKRYVKASADFRQFTEDPQPSTIDDVAWLRDTATVGGKTYEGNLFEVPKVHLDYIRQWFVALNADAELSRERMAQDAQHYADLPTEGIQATLKVSPKQKAISDKLIGVFFEDISYAADGGLYAELIQNRDFEYKPNQGRAKGWGPLYAWRHKAQKTETDRPLSANNPHYVVLNADTLTNYGWDGIALKKGAHYDFSLYTRANKNATKAKLKFLVRLVENGQVLAEKKLTAEVTQWTQLKAELIATADASKAELQIINLNKKTPIDIDMVSLFPQDTYKGHGLRRDLAEAIADLQPKFVRFPGGCMSHGQGIDNIYHWQHTVGPWQDRKPDYNIWHYHQTRGLGFYEFFQFCEDMGAEPLPVLAAGVPCQNSTANADGYGGQQGGIPMDQMDDYCQEFLHLIEWANGDPATSSWAKMRADAGHPAPFNLKYIGIGNEDLISTTFEERYLMIAQTIRNKYPDIQICGTAGPFHYPSSDYIEGWEFGKKHHDVTDLLDEHYYESTGWFLHHQDYYDHYPRSGAPKVYVGEYASKTRTMESALAEALYLCSVERNGDVVSMTSYAPLLAKEGHHNWNPDLIYFDNERVTLTPSYHTQRLFSRHGGNTYVETRLETAQQNVSHRLGATVVKDATTGKTHLKLVNALPVNVRVTVDGLTLPPDAQCEGFSAQPQEKSCQPIAIDALQLANGTNTVTLPPYAVVAITF